MHANLKAFYTVSARHIVKQCRKSIQFPSSLIFFCLFVDGADERDAGKSGLGARVPSTAPPSRTAHARPTGPTAGLPTGPLHRPSAEQLLPNLDVAITSLR